MSLGAAYACGIGHAPELCSRRWWCRWTPTLPRPGRAAGVQGVRVRGCG